MKYVIYGNKGAVCIKDFQDAIAAKNFARTISKCGGVEPYNSSMYKMIVDGKLPRPNGFVEIKQ